MKRESSRHNEDVSNIRLTPFQSDSKAANDVSEEESLSSIESKSDENEDNKAKPSDAEDEESSQEEEDESSKDVNRYRLIYPSKRNTEKEYEVYIDHAQKCYEQFTGSYSKKNREAKEAQLLKLQQERDNELRAQRISSTNKDYNKV